jgi:hypothetical protein
MTTSVTQQKGPIMADIPQRFDHTDDGFETANDGDFVSYDDYAALLARAEKAEAALKATLEREAETQRSNDARHSQSPRL